MIRIQTTYCIIGLFISTIIFATQGMAHDLWTTMDNYQMPQNNIASATVYSSHQFPALIADIMPSERMEQFLFVSPNGRQTIATNNGKGNYDSKAALEKTGTYLAIAMPVNGFATKTPEGYLRGKNRKDVMDPITCSYSQKFAKAVFSVGQPGGGRLFKAIGSCHGNHSPKGSVHPPSRCCASDQGPARRQTATYLCLRHLCRFFRHFQYLCLYPPVPTRMVELKSR